MGTALPADRNNPVAPGDRRAALAEVLRSGALAGKVRTATGGTGGPAGWPVPGLPGLLPRGLQHGQVVTVTGSAEVLLRLAGGVSGAGGWCALVGQPALARAGRAAAAAGVALERWLLVPEPGTRWADAAAALVGAVDLVVIAPAGPVPAALAGRLAARARQHGTVLAVYGALWPGPDVVVEAGGCRWSGIRHGRGQLRSRRLDVTAAIRGGRPRHITLGADTSDPAAEARGGLRLVTS
ncbi:hypothetical protein [Longispora albida]|uniref:hypothetical protein n=1 Tax=Longispora albida TaxID=203523 RepID=UPI00036C6291|nr:hypothetical protein [Longispora albida]